MHLRRRFVAITVLGAALFATPVAWGGVLDEPGPKPPPVHYVALGDSRAAAPRATSAVTFDGCGRSGQGYPQVIAATIKPASFTDVSCGGATTANIVRTPQQTRRHPAEFVPLQIDSVRSDTTLVTVSIGGNDINWPELLGPCFGTFGATDRHCRDNRALKAKMDARLATLPVRLGTVLDAVHLKAPQATVLLIGHGGYFGPTGCSPQANFSAADGPFIQTFFDRFNAVLRTAAENHQAEFVDIAGPAVGHDSCQPEDRRWFQGNVSMKSLLGRHPTPLGSKQMAMLVLEQWQRGPAQ